MIRATAWCSKLTIERAHCVVHMMRLVEISNQKDWSCLEMPSKWPLQPKKKKEGGDKQWRCMLVQR